MKAIADPQARAAAKAARRALARARLKRSLIAAFTDNPLSLIAAGLFLLLVALAIFGPLIAPYDALATDASAAMAPPSSKHWFGTDPLGRDVLSRVLVSTRLDMGIALAAVVLSAAVGGLAGACAGYFGGWTDRITGRLADTIMAFPLFVLAMGIVAALGNTVANIVLATAIINLPFYQRVARAESAVLRNAGYIEAARLSGNGEFKVLFRHIIPNILPPMAVQISLNMGWAILNAAGLSFIGLGARPRRNGESWSPRARSTSSPANGGSRSSPAWR
ncbi:MAG: ABC transporter permease [Candidatus Protistobacter heckmanni]|nr:ABC transporter permease [Candidatus Protistobacter heckmanni]